MHAEESTARRVPLSGHVLFQSSDLDFARERVAQKFCRHRLDLIGERTAFCATHNHVAGGMISLNYISYGADVLIDPRELGDFYLIQMPIVGAATIRNGSKEFLTNREAASILNADLATRMQWWEGCAQILVQIRKAPLLDFVGRFLGRELPGRLIFDPRIDFTRAEMQAWRRLACSLFQAAEKRRSSSGPAISATLQEQCLLETFLGTQPNNLRPFFQDQRETVAARHLKRAEEFMRANAALPITLLDIAKAADVAPRTLQLAYKRAFGISPIRALTRERLKRVRFDLIAELGQRSVTEIAFRWGFNHLGRFAAEYRREFGECPHETRDHARACR
jgi:AraC-like DNA-binding protein